MGNPVRYRGNQGVGTYAPNNGYNPSPFIWGDCPWADILNGHVAAVHFQDKMQSGPLVAAGAEAVTGIYKGFADTGGSVVDALIAGGGRRFSSDGDNEGASIMQLTTPLKLSRASKKLWFEACIQTSTITDTKHGFLLALAEQLTLSATVPIAAAGTLADQNFTGFHRLEGDGDQVDVVYKANGVTQVNVQTDALAQMPSGSGYTALIVDTDFKLAIRYDPADDYYVRYYCNGCQIGSKQLPLDSAAGTDFPNDVTLGMVFAVLNATATNPGNSTLRWWQYAQLQ